MGINLVTNTNAKASLKLYNHISSYMFEEEFGEMRGNTLVKSALTTAKRALAEIISKK